jgi:pyrroline-5-carboxylate reductase
MQNSIISFIGAGNMAISIIKGLLKENYPAKNIWATHHNAEKLNKLKNLNINLTTDNRYAVQIANIVVLAVKPQILKSVAIEIADLIQEKKPLVISIAVGISLKSLEQYLYSQQLDFWQGTARMKQPECINIHEDCEPRGNTDKNSSAKSISSQNLALIRCMPNTPSLIACGATGLYANQYCSNTQKNVAKSIFRSIGTVVWLPKEEQIDVVGALSGSGPAYFFLFIEALEQTGIELGLSKENANLLTLQTALGSARMAIESKKSMAELRQQVTSPGGTTERALKSLNNDHFYDIIKKALKEAKNRAEELAKI